MQQVPEDPEKGKVDLLDAGRICPREKVLITNELPMAACVKSVPALSSHLARGIFKQ